MANNISLRDILARGRKAKTSVKMVDDAGNVFTIKSEGIPETFDKKGLSAHLADAAEVTQGVKFLDGTSSSSAVIDNRDDIKTFAHVVKTFTQYTSETKAIVVSSAAPLSTDEDNAKKNKSKSRAEDRANQPLPSVNGNGQS